MTIIILDITTILCIILLGLWIDNYYYKTNINFSILGPSFMLDGIFNFSCNVMQDIFNNHPNTTCNQTCFEIRKVLRLGNSMVQFIRAIQLAKATGLKNIYYPPGFLSMNTTFKSYDIQFQPLNPINNFNCYKEVLWYPIIKFPRVPFEIDSEFQDFYQKQFYNYSIPDDVLVMHFRSGDIFQMALNNLYGQPPCSYYRTIARMKNWSKIILLSEDDLNPCINILSKEFGITFKNHSLKEDISILLNAPNIAFGYGSFQYAFILFSKKLKNLYLFNQPSSRLPDHYNCVPTKEYSETVLKNWMNSPIQREMMVNPNISCERWEFVRKGPSNTIRNIHEYAF